MKKEENYLAANEVDSDPYRENVSRLFEVNCEDDEADLSSYLQNSVLHSIFKYKCKVRD